MASAQSIARRSAAFLHGTVVAASLAAMQPQATEAGSSTRLGVTARVLGVVRITSIAVRQAIELSPLDANRNVLHVANAAIFEVSGNLPGYWLRFDVADPDVVEVEVRGLDTPVRVGATGASAYVPLARSGSRLARHTLDYVVRYGNGVVPGTRGAPLMLSLGNG